MISRATSFALLPVLAACAVRGPSAEGPAAALRRAAERGGHVRLPAGTVRISETVEIDLSRVGPVSIAAEAGARIEMAGPGPALRFKGGHGGTAAPGTLGPGVRERERMPLVDGLEIVGAHPEAEGIEAVGTMQATFTRVRVSLARHGIVLRGRNRNVIVSDCHLYENRGVGIYLDGVNLHQINIVGCHVSYNGGGGVVVRGGELRNLQIGTCDIEANMAADGPPTANVLVDLTEGGSAREIAVVGCTIQHTRNAPDSANVRLLGRSAADPVKVGHVAISHNLMSDADVNVHVRHARGVTLTGNSLWGATDHSIRAEGSSNLVLGPNLVDRNPDYKDRGRDGVLLEDCEDVSLTGLHVNRPGEGAACLTLRRCRRVNVVGGLFLDGGPEAVLIERSEDVRLTGAVLRGSPRALRSVGGRRNDWSGSRLDGGVEETGEER